jgi:N-acyl-phosphatidylethanolamine-hydrolysing phospholipase D
MSCFKQKWPVAFIYTALSATKLVVPCMVMLLAACSTTNEDYNPAKKHHRPEGFQNNYIENIDKSRFDLLRWKWQSIMAGLPKAPEQPTPMVQPDLKFVSSNAGAEQQPAITWIGHATMLVQMGGLNILTDPHFSERASPVQFAGPKRAQAPGMALKDLPRIDAVLISHNHYDHLDTNTVKALGAQAGGSPLFIVPLGVKKWFASQGITNVQQLDWWDKTSVKTTSGEIEVHSRPCSIGAHAAPETAALLYGAAMPCLPAISKCISAAIPAIRKISSTRKGTLLRGKRMLWAAASISR